MTKYSLASSTWDDEEIRAIQDVIETGRFTMGDRVIEFEERFSEKMGTDFSVMVNSGSSANLALLAACRYRKNPFLKPGDEVLVPAVSWSTTFYPVISLLDHAPIGPLPVADEIHEEGLFVGNHHFDLSKELDLLANTLTEFKRRF